MVGRASLLTAFLAGLLAEAGVIGAHRGLLSPIAGFRAFLLSLAVALLALALGILGIARRRGEHPRSRSAAAGLIVGALMALPVALGLMRCHVMGYPGIDDITTDFQNPPQFLGAGGLSPQLLQYDRGKMESIQRRRYPALGPLLLDESPDQAFAEVKQAANVPRFAGMEIAGRIPSMPGWFIVFVDPATRTVEGVETSFLFRFRDRFVIQVRTGSRPNTSLVEMRSRSQNGAADSGANYNRIVGFLALIKSRASHDAASRQLLLNVSQP